MLIERIEAQARRTPDKPAFIHNGVACSYAGFARRIAQAVRYFSQYQWPTTGVAVLWVDDLAQGWILGIALRGLGLATVAVSQAEDIAKLGLAHISCVVTWGPENAPDVAVKMVQTTAMTGGAWVNVPADVGAEIGAAVGEPPLGAASPGGHIIQTSGTTGAYKMILRDAVVEASTLDLHAHINEIVESSVVYVRDFPLWTAGGYRWPLLTWHQGATVVFQQGGDFHVPLLSPDVTHVFATPMTLIFVINSPELPVRRNDRMRLLVTGGAMPRALVLALKQRMTDQVYAVLASTEALTVGTTLVENIDELAWHRVHASREAQVVDDDDHPLPAGQVGLLRVKILDGVNGYLNDEAASRVFFRDGYFYPGDLAVLHEDGRVALCGRVTDVLNVLGHKIATAPIEAALQNQLSVDAVCLLSMPISDADDEVCVVIESHRELPQAELQAAARDMLNRFGRVRFFVFSELPRNRMGKVMRPALHQQLLARLARPS